MPSTPAHPWPIAAHPVEPTARVDVADAEPSPRRTAKRATFAARFAAIVIDLVLLTLVQVAVAWAARAAVATAGLLGRPLAGGGEIADLLAAVGGLVLPAVYFTTLHAGEGRTLGKHAMHLRVARPDGRPIGLLRSFLRWIGYEISAIPLGLG
ncbi:MAG: RDD family protein, partial [Alphaproteobacteria bacterium]